MKILVTGAKGQLGQEFVTLAPFYPQYHFVFADRNNLNLLNKEAIENFCKNNTISIIINCAAYTAVDKAESEKILVDLVNHKAVSYLAQIAKEHQIKLVHLSTDYVFNGEAFQPYKETDITSACNAYGMSKCLGEEAILHINPSNTIIIRTSWLHSVFGNNFVKTILKLGREKESINVVYDQIGTPTYAEDLAKTILDIIPYLENEHVEIYHYSNEGVTSWFDFAKEIITIAELPCKIFPIESTDYLTIAKRPYYSLLNKLKIKKDFNIEIPYWKDSLRRCIKKLKEKNKIL